MQTNNITDKNFSIEKLLNGERNSMVKQGSFGFPSANGDRLAVLSSTASSIYSVPAANRKIRIVSSEAGDDQDLIITGVDVDGNEVSTTMTLNGTSNVDSTALMVMVNNVVASGAVPAGTVSVNIDNAGNDGFATRLGQLYGGVWGSTLHLVPNGKKLIVSWSCFDNGLSWGTTFTSFYTVIKNWIEGNTVAVRAQKIGLYWVNIIKTVQADNQKVFEPGDLFYILLNTNSSTAFELSYQMIQYDS